MLGSWLLAVPKKETICWEAWAWFGQFRKKKLDAGKLGIGSSEKKQDAGKLDIASS
jgi:hypothetical protein